MENLLIPFQAVRNISGNRILVLAPHPDDEVFGCGGAILRHVERHDFIQVIIVTNGAHGVDDTEKSSYIHQRQQESQVAAAILGYGNPVFWHYQDRELSYGEKLVTDILAAIQQTDAELIYAPSVYEIHPDHRALSMAAIEAVRRSDHPAHLAMYEIGQPVRPNLLLDISDLADRKMEAMRCFASQLAKQRYDLDIAALNRYRTYTLAAEVTAAEAYILTSTAELASDPLNLFQSEHTRQQKSGLAIDTEDLPLVSVIVRSMDRSTLADTLDSVALQTYPNIEIVIVNAKGTGHKKLDPWCGRFPLRVTTNDEPLHRSRAANLGLQTAKGKYLIFLDDDDFFYPEHVNNLVAALQNRRNARCAYAGVRVEHYTDDVLDQVTEFNEPYNHHRLLSRNFLPIHAVLFEKSLVDSDQCAFDENLDVFEDWDFWIQISLCCEIVHIDKISAVYRNYGDSGLGRGLDKIFLRKTRSRVYEKWKSRFSGEQLEDMVLYWEDKTESLTTQLAASTAQVHTLQIRVDHLENDKQSNTQFIQLLQNSIHSLQSHNKHLTGVITSFTQSTSWKITAPLRFVSRIVHGQYREAWNGLRSRMLPFAKKIYRILPARLRQRVVAIVYRFAGSLFAGTEHYELWRIEQQFAKNPMPIHANTALTGLTDISETEPLATPPSGRIAIHAHIFYADLANEFAMFLKNMPYPYDLFVSAANETDRDTCQRIFSRLPQLKQLVITVVPNRGRDIAPFFCTFGQTLQQYDYIAHIHSKKSLYSDGKADGWREYLLNHLLGSQLQIRKIFSLLTGDQNAGLLYPQNFTALPHWANTWLSNKTIGYRLCRKLGIAPIPSGYFDFPAGSMFWAQSKAIQPLFNAGFNIEDFPEEAGQNDATLAHCIERVFALTTRQSGFSTIILQDKKSLSWSRWRIDRYMLYQQEIIETTLRHPDVRVVVFDIFDTLVTRPLLNPEDIKKIIAQRASGEAAERYLEFRVMAENQARQGAGRDVGLGAIYRELSALSGLSAEVIEQLRTLEETIESSAVSPRPEAIALFQLAKSIGKRVILASDMYLPKPIIENLLAQCGISGWHAFYLSSESGLRKDTGDFYQRLLADENVSPHEILIIGDNEQSDVQKPGDFKFRVTHVMRPVELARATPRFEPVIENACNPDFRDDLNTQLTLGAIVQANFQPLFYPDFDPAEFVPASPWSIGFTIAGPLILSFVQWLAKKAAGDAMQRLYFVAREGQILKIAYDLWTSDDRHAVPSEYLVLSRRTITVPMITNLEDIYKIACTDYAPNPMPDFIFERYGIVLSDEECETLAKRKLWPHKKKVFVENGNIDHLKPLLQALEKRILEQAMQERPALLAYLQNTGLNADNPNAIVDVGYAATTQGYLNRLLQQKVHGYYLITLDTAEKVAKTHQVITQGYYYHFTRPSATEPVLYRKSFTLEKIFSADDAQVVRYRTSETGEIVPEFRLLSDEERQSAATRAEIRRGILEFIQQSIKIRNNLVNNFVVPSHLAETLFLQFIENPSESELDLLRSIVLDDFYYGHGLVR
ncbi:Glycosyl transferase family 2 [Nitrosomonas marina]|uniref:Glycosyl transferase family 2 n=1 Tax=Nitrosomonas marina TaxID=917 RepID=A0A1I0CTN1_9PROT|nr:rhamnan synthesis F family protein [Nitrosomonas marina]SET22960.1 Glycosyl transferase family 2 [Nitrosomonas marina]